MADVAAFGEAIAHLLWPIFALVAILVFREPIKELLFRLRSGKILGQEIELERSLQLLEENAQAAVHEIPTGVFPVLNEVAEEKQKDTTGTEDETDIMLQVIHEADKSPKAALILLAAEIERELRQLLATTGLLKNQKMISLPAAIHIFEERGVLPKYLSSSVSRFWDVRNRIVHGHGTESDDVLRAIDSGFTILKVIRSIPHSLYKVYHPSIVIYSDSDVENPIQGVHAVILETTSPGGVNIKYKIFPTTKVHFEKGKQVAWEWDLSNVYGEAWYRDPDTDEVKKGWSSSGEFVGRNLSDI